MLRGTQLTMPPQTFRRSVPSLPAAPRRVVELPIPESDQALVAALKAGRSEGKRALFECADLAAFLQAGLLVPAQDESLTVRATRSALAKLDVDPSRLLN